MNLFKSTTTFSFFTLISRILGYIRDILIAIFLGSGPLADAFFVAFRIPNTFRRLFSEGTFNAAFVPSYASELANGKDQSEKFATSVFSLLIISLFFLVEKEISKRYFFLHDFPIANDSFTIGKSSKKVFFFTNRGVYLIRFKYLV